MFVKAKTVTSCAITKSHLNKFLALKRYSSIHNKCLKMSFLLISLK